MFNDNIQYKKKVIRRVLAYFSGGNTGVGSGFFVNKNGIFLTCFHVAFGGELKNLRNDPDFIAIKESDEHKKLETWYSNKINKIEVELPDSSKEELKLVSFDEKYDIAVLKLENKEKIRDIDNIKFDFKKQLKQGDHVFFGGFPISYPYKAEESPFAINTGMVSSFPNTIIGGDFYEHAQINSVNLGGNSGAPLFIKNKNKVIGIINGNMNWGSDFVVFKNKSGKEEVGPLRVPLSIAYATPVSLLKKESKVFKSAIS